MSDPMAEIRASFFVECEELLEALQDGLMAMDGGDQNSETINVCFRAVHSMKGGAGAFGLDQLVRFAHRYETVMDEVRSGRLEPDRDAMMLFFRAADVLSDIVRASRDDEELTGDETEAVLTQLEALAGDAIEAEAADEATDFQPMTLALDFGDPIEAPEDPAWIIRFRPHVALFESGNEPQHLLRTLASLGSAEIECDTSTIPAFETFNPESALLSWTVRLHSTCSDQDIRDVFDFVEGICDLEISGGASGLAIPDLSELPNSMDDDDADVPSEKSYGASRLTLSAPKPDDLTADELHGADQNAVSLVNLPPAQQPNPRTTDADLSPPRPTRDHGNPASSRNKTVESDKVRPTKDLAKPPQTSQSKPTVRVDLDRIDRLVNLVGELVINQAMLSQSVQETEIPSNSPVKQGLEEFMQLTRDIQDSVMMIRAQPVKSLFQRMSRIVREASSAVNKRVRFVTDGEATEVDKTVIERLADPLTHMIRNAVDHGLESNADRLASGKPEEGQVSLSAVHRSGRVVIEISDDGGGINRKKVREIAEHKDLIPEGLMMTDGEIDNLLFLPGFSTAKEVSNLSGRGVGMDVVRSAIQELGGRITIASEPGIGTTFSISLPLTLAVLDGMVVKSGGETLVVPLGSIVETLSLEDSEIQSIGPDSSVLQIRDSFVPVLDLAANLGYRAPLKTYSGNVVLLITQEDGTRAALIVDSIEEQRQVVIKGLQESYGSIPGIAAATILGDGQVALILDPVDLMTNITNQATEKTQALELTG